MKKTGFSSLGLLKMLIWAFLILLLFEGALRKWVLPSLADPLLIIRDPIVILIYLLAMKSNRFPAENPFIIGAVLLGAISFLFSFLAEYKNLWVTFYGIRINYLYIPLIFVIPRILDENDILKMGRVLIYCSLGMTAIIVLQFFSSQGAFINRQIGGLQTIGITGAEGRFRPSGTFSFITGVSAFYPLVTAFLFAGLIRKNIIPKWLMVAGATAVVIAIPFSISRLTALSCALVLLAGLLSAFALGIRPGFVARAIAILAILAAIVPFLPFVHEGIRTFETRWNISTEQGFKVSILDRYISDFVTPITHASQAPFFGYGIGAGSNVGSKLLTGKRSFLLGEGEWSRIVMELGMILGLIYIIYRIALTWYLFKISFRALMRGNALPILILSASGLLILHGQWGPPTILGFAIFGAGLTVAAARNI